MAHGSRAARHTGDMADALLAGKVALVTGAGNGIGRATARLFAEHGAAVAVVDVQHDLAREVAEQIVQAGGTAHAFGADVSVDEEVQRTIEAAANQLGGLQILINNAGISGGGNVAVDGMPLERWDRTMRINLRAHLVAAQCALPWLRQRGGAIVGTASSAGLTSLPGSADYAISKAGVVMLTRQLAAEWGKYGIRVNCVAPGVIDTGFGQPRQPGQERPPRDPRRYEYRSQFIPLGRVGTAEDIAGVMLFLASDLAGFVTGQAILADGGELTNVKQALGWGRPPVG